MPWMNAKKHREIPDPEYKNWAAWRVYLPHAMALLANLVEDSEASADLCIKAGYHLNELGRYSESLILYERARKLYADLLGEENTKTIQAMHVIGCLLHNCGRLEEAQQIQEKVLEAMRRIGRGDDDTLECMNNLAITYESQGGRLEEVQELREKVLEVSRRALGEEHLYTLISMQNLADTYRDMGGRLREVQELEEKALEVRRRTLGEEHPDTLKSMHNLAITYESQGGRLKEVQELREKVLEMRRRTLGDEHLDTLKSMQNLAVTYRHVGRRLDKVQELEEKVLEVRRRNLGEEHPDTADAMNNLAQTLHDRGRLDEAISLMEEAACSYACIYDSDHSKTKRAEQAVGAWKDEIEDDDYDEEDSIHGDEAE